MGILQRLFNFQGGTTISSSQVDAEFDQLVGGINQHSIDIPNAQTAAINFAKGYGLGSTCQDISSQNLNNLDVTGFYQGSSLTNYPTDLLTGQGYIINMKISGFTRKQIFFCLDASRIYQRYQLSGIWLPWYEILTTDTNYIDLTLTNGALEFSTDRRPGYMKVGKVIYIRGAVKNISAASVIIGTLPAGYRPSAEFSITATTSTVSNKSRSARVSFATNGDIQIQFTVDGVYTVNDIYYLTTSFTL